jgi:hypothetical protein
MPTGEYQRPRTTGEGLGTARARPQTWGDSQTGKTAPEVNDGYRLVTVADAVESFHANTRENGSSRDRMTSLEHLLTLRLIPFAKEHKLQYTQEMDNATFTKQ